MGSLRKLVKNGIQSTRVYLDNRDRNQTAFRLLKSIEEEKGKLKLSDKKLCQEYAVDVLGNKVYTPWLFVYNAFSGEFKEGWIPDNYYAQCVIPNVGGSYGEILERNAITDKLLNVRNSLDICYYINNFFYGINNDVLNENNLKEILFKEREKVVFKTEDSQQGAGIYFFDSNSFTIDAIRKLGDGVFQNYIKQHSFFLNFTKSSVATIRITGMSSFVGTILSE
ncbi:MAG: hypothetical protein P8K68_11585 [Algibacter sp.]|uniref:hypothetical protein n=1 Tax=Algibacter sp. TaxID=1872428 RepID=UPI0026226E52|nr:hypothetical protein [Algibacter sp.]MDG1730907.1 hypothetical protein [Algibacter sp.]MDG2179409.1 hypothetical protein [Algibacter sp.]